MPAIGSGQRFVALDSLRGIAALSVAALHLHLAEGLFSTAYVRNAYLGVDFFFVLSGFVIAGSYGAKLQAGMRMVHFIGLRLGRLYPLHFLMLAIFLAMEFATLLPQLAGLGSQDPFSGTQTPVKFIESLLLVQSFGVPINNDWNGPSWSIAVEFWLYLMAAWIWRLAGNRGWIMILAAVIAAAFGLVQYFDQLSAPFSPGLIRGVLGVGMGVCSWEVWTRFRPVLWGPITASLWELAVVTVVIVVVAYMPETNERYVLASLAFALVVAVFALEAGIVSRILKQRCFLWLGTLSYSIYMVHGMLIGRAMDALRWLGFEQRVTSLGGTQYHMLVGGPHASNLVGIIILCVSVSVAFLTWRFIEEPCRKWSRLKISPRLTATSSSMETA